MGRRGRTILVWFESRHGFRTVVVIGLCSREAVECSGDE